MSLSLTAIMFSSLLSGQPAPKSLDEMHQRLMGYFKTLEERLAKIEQRLDRIEQTRSERKPLAQDEAPEPLKPDKPFRIVSINARVTEQNRIWWKYAWILELENNTDRAKVVSAVIRFLDADGFEIDSAQEYNIAVPARGRDTVRGVALIQLPGAERVRQYSAEIQP